MVEHQRWFAYLLTNLGAVVILKWWLVDALGRVQLGHVALVLIATAWPMLIAEKEAFYQLIQEVMRESRECAPDEATYSE